MEPRPADESAVEVAYAIAGRILVSTHAEITYHPADPTDAIWTYPVSRDRAVESGTKLLADGYWVAAMETAPNGRTIVEYRHAHRGEWYRFEYYRDMKG